VFPRAIFIFDSIKRPWMKFKSVYIFFLIAVIAGCKSTKETPTVRNLPEITVSASEPEKIYRASNTMSSDLIHTKLEVRFDRTKKYLYGKATITLKPHFYPVDNVYLNARVWILSALCRLPKKENRKPHTNTKMIRS
jgi:hypothetical protein